MFASAALLLALASPSPAETRLGLPEAMQLAFAHNVRVGLAAERVRDAEGRLEDAGSVLLPRLQLTASQLTMNENLAALGFTPGLIPGIPLVLGPFGIFDARVRLTQRLLDVGAFFKRRSAKAALEAARLDEELTREQVAATAALAYVEAVRSERALDAARADLDLAGSLLDLARDRLKAGVATAVDVAREETRMAEARLEDVRAEHAAVESKLRLERVVGLELGGAVSLTDDLKPEAAEAPAVEQAVAEGLAERREVGLAEKNLESADADLSSARGERAPVVSAFGDVGDSASTPGQNSAQTHTIGVAASLPVFDGGQAGAHAKEASSEQSQARLLVADEKVQVEEDVRLAIEDIRTGRAQVEASETAVRLALKELDLARDRFASGVGSTIEVLNAEDALARARNDRVEALAALHRARLSLAAAVGRAASFRL